jgi:hypothetical protein
MTPFSLPFGNEWWMLALVETAAIVIDYPSEHLSLLLVLCVVCRLSSPQVSFGYFLRDIPLDKIPGKVESFRVIARTTRNRWVLCVE